MNSPVNQTDPLLSSIQRIITNNIGPLLIAQLIAFVINFLQLIYLARVLTPENFGIINFALTIQFFAFMLTNLGISFMGTRELVIKRSYDPLLFWNITALRLLLSLGFIAIASLWFFTSEPDHSRTIIYLLYLFSVIPIILTPDWVFTGLEMMKVNSLIKILIAVSGFILTIFLIKRPDDLLLVPVIYLVSMMAGLIVGLICLKKITRHWSIRIQPMLWVDYIRKSIKLGLTSYLVVAIASIDVFIIGIFLTSSDVGYYSAVSKLILAIHTMLSLIVTAIFPAVTRTMEQKPQLIKRLSPHIIMLILAMEIPVCMLISTNSDLCVYLLYGSKYSPAIPVLSILIWSIIPVTICHIYSTILNASFRESVVMKILILQIILLISAMIVGTMQVGIMGAAGTIVLTGLIICAVYVIVFKNEIIFPTREAMILIIFILCLLGVNGGLYQYEREIFGNFIPRILPVIIIIMSLLILRLIPVEKLIQIIWDK